MAYCGYRTGVIFDQSRAHWRRRAARPIAWSAWYPTEESAGLAQPQPPFFDPGSVLWNAEPAPGMRWPVVLLSHGTGGTAESLGWLARALACAGHVVLGANHHGNTGSEPFLAEGFLCWWERAADLSVLLSSLSAEGVFADLLDLDHVSAVGFSLGGHTVLTLAGARTSLDRFDAWRAANKRVEAGPREFPDAADHIPDLIRTSAVFRTSWARHGDDFSDPRVTSVVAIAPAPPVRSFHPGSMSDIALPVTLLTGGADTEAPPEHCADWLVSLNDRFVHHTLGQEVGHYTFLSVPQDKSLLGTVDIFTDADGVDRLRVHERAAQLVRDSLS